MKARSPKRIANKKGVKKKSAKKKSAKKRHAKTIAPTIKKYLLRLYITGPTPQSQHALANIKRICEKYLKNNYELRVIDIYQAPQLAKDDQIIATPTLIKLLPAPLRRLIGDLSSEDRVLQGLGLKARSGKFAATP